MHLEYQLTIKDFREAVFSHNKSMRLLMSIYCNILGFVLLFTEYQFFGLMIIIYTIYFIYLSPKNRLEREWQANSLLKEYYNLEIDDEYIYAKSSLSETKYCWQVFRDFRETKHLFILYQSRSIMWIIPKSAFLEGEDRELFISLAEEKIGASLSNNLKKYRAKSQFRN